MASTNKTTNYELSQFLGTDKPAWLSDYNSDMNKIDTQMKANADAATAAGGTASSANTAIGTLSELTTTAKTSVVAAINEVDSNADTAQNTANQAYTDAYSALERIGILEQALNITNIQTCTLEKSANISSLSGSTIKCATNADKSLFKLYGQVVVQAPQGTTNCSITIKNTGLGTRDTAYTIEGAVLSFRESGNVSVLNSTVNTDGSVTISGFNFVGETATRFYLAPILYFDKNFGD